MKNSKGTLYGIGVGPGEAELITYKAVRTIEDCDLIVLPAESKDTCYSYQIVEQVYPAVREKEILCMPFPMIKDEKKLKIAHEKIYSAIANELKQEHHVGFLTIGDPSVYSTYLYMHTRAKEAGFEARMVSGVPSFCAVAARLGISLGEGTEEIHIIPASYDIAETLSYKGTRVYMKSGKKLKELIEALRSDHRTVDCEVCGVANCGMENEQVYHSLEELEGAKDYLTTIIVKQKSREHSYRFFENRACQYFPCHGGVPEFNCLFCYCPLYAMKHCPGAPEFKEKNGRRLKICTNCNFPHKPGNYDQIIELLKTPHDSE